MGAMYEYEFELVYRLEPDEDPEQYVEALYAAGCDDCLIGIGRKGSIGLMFNREAKSALVAIRSAVKQVRQAIPHASASRLERVGPWLMNLSELAEEFGFTKQNMSRYQRGESAAGAFPAPYVAGKTSYWEVLEVASWLKRNNVGNVEPEKIELYRIVKGMNLALQWKNRPKQEPEAESLFEELLTA